MTTKLWIVGKFVENGQWEFSGVFDKKEFAIDRCVDDKYFIGSAILNENVSHEQVEWPESYYPKAIDRYSKEDQDRFNSL